MKDLELNQMISDITKDWDRKMFKCKMTALQIEVPI